VLIRDTYQLNLIVWDLAGGDDYSKTGANYLRGAAGALIVCDLTRSETLRAFETYSQQLLQVNPDAVFVYAGNKVDLEADRAISDEILQERKSNYYGPCLLTSAKTGQNVEEAFALLAEQIEKQL
jgi:small GTP-binding protein